jgi:hypothetical protein
METNEMEEVRTEEEYVETRCYTLVANVDITYCIDAESEEDAIAAYWGRSNEADMVEWDTQEVVVSE